MSEHRCLACGTPIRQAQAELTVPGRGKMPPRYRHASDDDCRAALDDTSHHKLPGIKGKGKIGNLPTLEDIERNM